jgi:hypothetical protein
VTELYTATTYARTGQCVVHMLTKSRFVDEMEENGNGDSLSNAGAALLCLSESLMGGMGADERVSIGFVSVSPATGEVVYDEFTDGAMRTELEVCAFRQASKHADTFADENGSYQAVRAPTTGKRTQFAY